MQRDLTTGSITRHLFKTTGFMLVTMVFQTLYFLIDLYWVGQLGTQAVAAVGIAGNLTFIVLALTQMLGVGTTTVVSHAAGRKNHEEALLLFNQSQVLALVTGVVFLLVGFAARWPYSIAMSADAITAELAATYLLWFIPAMALQFALVAMGSALRAVGNFRTGMVVSTATVILNMILAPILIFGWGTGRPFGVAGAAISSLVAIVVALVWLAAYFLPAGSYLRFVVADWKPRFDLWKRMLAIGLPSGFELGVTALYIGVVYSIARPFGAAAQAGFGIGQRIIQAGFMPVVALAFSVAPVAGQNFGARHARRVTVTFRNAAWMAGGIMALFTIVCVYRCRTAGEDFFERSSRDRDRRRVSPDHRVELRGVGAGLRRIQHVPGYGQHGSVAHQLGPPDCAGDDIRADRLAHFRVGVALDLVRVRRLRIPSVGAEHDVAAPRVHAPPAVGSRDDAGVRPCQERSVARPVASSESSKSYINACSNASKNCDASRSWTGCSR